jgi:lipopolysaccharide/colanic/teichoic acid biosynthesis glycosyltransferase
MYLLRDNTLLTSELRAKWESSFERETSLIKQGLPRFIELVLSLFGLVLIMPLLLIAIVLIRLTSSGPAIFRQARVGRKGKIFVLYKLRTMCARNKGAQVTTSKDMRVTCVGRFLRRMKIDELPELWNVVKGDMSLVGPRPEVPNYVNPKDTMWRVVLEVRPGLTDPTTLRLRDEENLLASVNGNPESFYIKTVQPFKLRGYAQYLKQRSWRSDVKVISQTLLSIVFPRKTQAPTMKELLGNRRKRGSIKT